MMSDVRPMLSLLAQYDDLTRITEQLTCGIEEECIEAVQAQFYHLQQFHGVQKEIDNKNNEIEKLRNENNILNTRLKHARSLIETEMKKRLKVEDEKQSLERQIALIKEVLLTDQNALDENAKEKLAFLSTLETAYRVDNVSPRTRSGEVRAGPFDVVNLGTIEESIGSFLSPSDISFDKTDEDLDTEIKSVKERRSRSKRASSSSKKTLAKKSKLYDFASDEQETTGVSDSESLEKVIHSDEMTRSTHTYRNTRSKYPSEPAPVCDVPSLRVHKSKSESEPIDIISFKDVIPETPDRNSTGGPFRRFSSTGKMNRNHVFASKVLIRPEKCHPCGEKIQYFKQALKCSDCRLTCHPECKDKIALPCYPSTPTPSGKVGMMGIISDYTPTIPPMIPAILVHCINEIESRGLEQVGLYRVSGSEREVKELKEKFLKGKIIPSLNKNDIHAICGCVKEFLRSLREPIITRKLWKNFVNAAESMNGEDLSAVYEAINNLPQPNRDTLAFLINHLHIVAESPKCLMPIENIAKIFAPTVIGYSVTDPVAAEMLSETRSQNKVMKLLLDIPVDFWRNFISCDNVFKSDTPETLSVHGGNRLGPITRNTHSTQISSYQSRGVVLAKTALTPRNGNPVQKRQKKTYFASPLLK